MTFLSLNRHFYTDVKSMGTNMGGNATDLLVDIVVYLLGQPRDFVHRHQHVDHIGHSFVVIFWCAHRPLSLFISIARAALPKCEGAKFLCCGLWVHSMPIIWS